MKVKSLNKEKENMSEQIIEPVGIKVKDSSDHIEETFEEVPEIVEPKENPEPIPVPLEPGPEVLDKEEVKKEDDGYKKIGCARLINKDGVTVYRFDVAYKEFSKNDGIIEFRNIVNNFESVRPTTKREYKDFIAMFGIIRWNFAKTVMPVNTDPVASLVKVESLINEHIVMTGIKKGKYEFKVDTEI